MLSPSLIKASASTLTVQWGAGSSALIKTTSASQASPTPSSTRYVLEQCISEENDEWTEIWNGCTNMTTVKGLESGKAYQIRVYAVNDGVQSFRGPSEIFNTLLETPSPPKL
eukprot:12668020-Ditylum_brightwellii.AAC.1